MIRKILALLAITLTFPSGCTLMPEYTRPEAPVPEEWPAISADANTGERQGVPLATDLKWREFYTDKRLRQTIAMALENNRNIRVAALNVEKARAYYRIRRAELLPTVNATGSGYKEHVPGDLTDSGRSTTREQYRVDLGISSWEIDFFGRIRSLKEAALEQYLATEAAWHSARIMLVSEVATAYLALAADREILQLARSTLKTQRASYDLIRRRFEGGLVPELDLRQAQTRVDAARVDVARYTELTARDKNALNLLVGAPVPPDLLPKALNEVTRLPEVSAGASSEILLCRPDILQAENLLKAANADIGAARAAFFPRISLTAAFGTASKELSGLFDSGSDTWLFAPQATLPIFDPRTWSALDVSRAQGKIALAQYEAAIQSAFREVADALAQKATLKDRISAQESLVEATAAAHRLSSARYEKGVDTYLAVLDAQRSLYSARQDLISVRLAELANQVRLYEVLGGGIELPQSLGRSPAAESIDS